MENSHIKFSDFQNIYIFFLTYIEFWFGCCISFKNNIFEDDFNLEHKKCGVSLQFNDKTERFDIVFEFIENYVFVCAFSSIPI